MVRRCTTSQIKLQGLVEAYNLTARDAGSPAASSCSESEESDSDDAASKATRGGTAEADDDIELKRTIVASHASLRAHFI